MRSIAGLLVPPQPEMKTKKEVPSASVWKLERREKCRYKGGSEVGSLGSGWGWGVGDGWYLHSQHLLGRKQSEQGHPRLHINFKASLGFLGLSQKSNRERQPGVVAHTQLIQAHGRQSSKLVRTTEIPCPENTTTKRAGACLSR